MQSSPARSIPRRCVTCGASPVPRGASLPPASCFHNSHDSRYHLSCSACVGAMTASVRAPWGDGCMAMERERAARLRLTSPISSALTPMCKWCSHVSCPLARLSWTRSTHRRSTWNEIGVRDRVSSENVPRDTNSHQGCVRGSVSSPLRGKGAPWAMSCPVLRRWRPPHGVPTCNSWSSAGRWFATSSMARSILSNTVKSNPSSDAIHLSTDATGPSEA
mmetsp:Transcript_66971/g.158022  ORF Transcript_66971/g.158022 Transcript_66971/m.158022 type:complete len:219 (+) Transcript_66971:407-1063(+)